MKLHLATLAVLVSICCVTATSQAANLSVEGGCTLQEALAAAGTDRASGACPAGDPGHDTVQITGNFRLEADALPVAIEGAVTILGGGSTLTVGSAERGKPLFEVSETGSLRIEKLSIAGGSLHNRGELELVHVTIDGDSTDSAIVNEGELTVIDSSIRGSKRHGIESRSGNLQIANSDISGNVGDGVQTIGSDIVTISNSTITNNGDDGVWAYLSDEVRIVHTAISGNGRMGILASEISPVTVISSSISENTSHGVNLAFGTVNLAASTLSGNGGSGINGQSGFNVFLRNVTVTGNATGLDGSPYLDDAFNLGNSVIADNNGLDCDSNALEVGSGNLDSDGSCGIAGPMTGLDPVLADIGGPKMTHALLPGSSAIDENTSCLFGADQRGQGHDALCDSGAFEFGTAAITLDSTATCPGPMSFTAVGSTPNGEVEFYYSAIPGSAPLSEGACAGTTTALLSPRFLGVETADAAGVSTLSIESGDPLCGRTLQAIDLTTCTPSVLTPIGRPPV